MGIIGEDVLEIIPDSKSGRKFQLGTDGGLQLGGYLRTDVSDQRKGVVQVVVGSAIAQILIHKAAARNGCSQEDENNMLPISHGILIST